MYLKSSRNICSVLSVKLTDNTDSNIDNDIANLELTEKKHRQISDHLAPSHSLVKQSWASILGGGMGGLYPPLFLGRGEWSMLSSPLGTD